MTFSSLLQLQSYRSDVDITVALPLKNDTPKPHPRFHFSLPVFAEVLVVIASGVDSRWNAGVGITEALTLVRLCIKAMRCGAITDTAIPT